MKSLAMKSWLIGASMMLAAIAAWAFRPELPTASVSPSLAVIVPTEFGEWKELRTALPAIDPRARGGEADTQNPYDDVLMRAYRNAAGDIVLLALAYGRNQRQEVKIHRPELCYVSQGFRLLKQNGAEISVPSVETGRIDGTRMLVSASNRVEAVSYWIRIGDLYSSSAWKTRFYILSQGLKGHVVDGMLVRVSQVLPDTQSASTQRFELQERFMADLVRAMPATQRHLLVGSSST